jgi:hypothetical protein
MATIQFLVHCRWQSFLNAALLALAFLCRHMVIELLIVLRCPSITTRTVAPLMSEGSLMSIRASVSVLVV